MTITDHPVFVVMVVAATAPLLAELPKRLRVPVVVLEVLLGVAVGPHGLGWLAPGPFIDKMSQIGMATLLFMASRAEAWDRWLKADTSAIETLKQRMASYQAQHARIASTTDLVLIFAVAIGATGLAHFLADPLVAWIKSMPAEWRLQDYSLDSRFFWLVVIATTIGVVASLTRARELEGAGASKIGTVFLYMLIATIGMQMDLKALADKPFLLLLGLIWISVHAGLMLLVARLIRAPLFFMAVGSQANIGAAASAPVVASAFHPALAPVGVLLAVLGYVLGTYCAYLTGLMLQAMAGG